MKKLAFILLIALFSCEFDEQPNLVIGNHFSDGLLYITDLPSDELILKESFPIFSEKYLFLDIGTYKIRLVADYGDDPTRQDRTMIINIPSIYTDTKVLFR